MKRWTSRVLICVLLGMVINIAVAWILAVTVNVYQGEKQLEKREIQIEAEDDIIQLWRVIRAEAFGSIRIYSTHVEYEGDLNDQSRPEVWGEPANMLPSYASSLSQPGRFVIKPGSFPVSRRWIDARGWPLRSLSANSYLDVTAGNREDVHFGIELSSMPWGGPSTWRGARVVPLQPIWIGFAFNSLFYASIVYTLIFSIFEVRRRWRRNRGACITCGHMLLNEQGTCPECGWRRGTIVISAPSRSRFV